MPTIITQTQNDDVMEELNVSTMEKTVDGMIYETLDASEGDFQMNSTMNKTRNDSNKKGTMNKDDDVDASNHWRLGLDNELVAGTAKRLVQITLFGDIADTRSKKVVVRSHLREKKEMKKTVHKKKTGRKQAKRPKTLATTTINDPNLDETLSLMEQLRFDNTMELRERVFAK
jgi:hypothetical protein